MGGFYFPTFPDFEDNGQVDPYLDIYRRMRSLPETDYGSFLKADDPELLNYQHLATSPTGSEQLISDYVSRRPTMEEYKPGTGRKLAAILLGSLSGKDPANAYALSRSILNEPFQRSLEDWKNEGTGITSRARLLDAERQRELAASKYGLQNKVSQLRADELAKSRKDTAARALAGKELEQERSNQAREDRNEQLNFRNNLLKMVFDATQEQRQFTRQHMLDTEARLKKEAEDRQKSREEDDLLKQNKKIEAFASTLGVNTGDWGNIQDIAKAAAYKKAMSNPAFSDLIQEDPSADKPFSIITPKYGTDRVRILENYIKSLTAKYLRGEFN